MNLVDSCGWLEFFAGTNRARLFEAAIRHPDRLLVPTICIMEVSKILARSYPMDGVVTAVSAMRQGTVVALDDALAIEAGLLSTTLKMPSVDSIVLATAQRHGATVWTQDADFAGKPGVKYFPKP
ncbi:MAG: type II toxin-antitoxin system VapC family toxin [Planctomycetota bacterium]